MSFEADLYSLSMRMVASLAAMVAQEAARLRRRCNINAENGWRAWMEDAIRMYVRGHRSLSERIFKRIHFIMAVKGPKSPELDLRLQKLAETLVRRYKVSLAALKLTHNVTHSDSE